MDVMYHDDCYWENLFDVDSNCIIKVKKQFFLLLDIQAKVKKIGFEPLFIVRISEETALKLLKHGVKQCKVSDHKPTGKKVDFKCVLVIDSSAFRVYEVKHHGKEEFVLVKSPLCNVCEGICL